MGCEADSFEDDLADLSSAEDFLDYFAIDYRRGVVQVNRLHILQRYHDYLAKQEAGKAPDYHAWRKWLERAYQDFRRLQRAAGEGARGLSQGRRIELPSAVVADELT
jgi:hypothetical protein